MFKQFLISAVLASASTCAFAQNFTSPVTINTSIGLGDYAIKVQHTNGNLIPTYANPVFSVTGNGDVNGTSLVINPIQQKSTSPKLSIRYDTNKFIFSTSSYRGYYYPITFKASAFTFDNATSMTINCPVTCKNSFDVISLNANDITVGMPNAADYVFEDGYDLKSLKEIETYVKENKHLPGMPSATEFAEKGMSVSEMSNKLLEKVEELTLHMIRLEKENLELKKEIQELKK
ncbi:MAG: hypothetical protein IKP81_13370 [Paludibacteraceae bacterium]|nr:hypothetical protein [Paludibacteraceae bacterium]